MALAPSRTGVVQLSQFGLSWLRPRDCSETVEIPPLLTWLRQNPCLVSAWVRAGRWASYYFTNLWIRQSSFWAFNFSLISFSGFKKLWSITAFISYLWGEKKTKSMWKKKNWTRTLQSTAKRQRNDVGKPRWGHYCVFVAAHITEICFFITPLFS